MAKRKKRETKKISSKYLTYIVWFLAVVALSLSALLAGYYMGYKNAKKEFSKKIKYEKSQRLILLKKLEQPKIEKNMSVTKQLKEVLKKETKEYVSASHEIEDETLADEPKISKRKIRSLVTRPKLAIIIDDVGTKTQVKAIKHLHLPLTMSFLPPSKYRPNTPKLAALENLYMVHLPLEAQSFSAEEPFTLRVTDSQKIISNRIAKIKHLFPKVHYINNHTGSKFTSNEIAMNKLIYVLQKNHINFIDSRTTAQTKAPKVLKNFGLKYVARDVFLDHHMDKPYILEQIKKAILVAKKHGTAIAIGHPHKNTLQALYESKKLFKNIDLVYINKL